jgi:hypothetical protein
MSAYGWLIQNKNLSPVICPSLKRLFPFRRIKRNEMGGSHSMYGARRSAYKVLMGKPVGKRPLGRPRSKWEDNI